MRPTRRLLQPRSRALVLPIAFVVAACAAPATDDPDLIFIGGAIYGLGPSDAAATALAVKDDRVLAIGSDREIRALAGPSTQVMELEYQVILPGFVDAWADLEAIGRWSEGAGGGVDLRLASTPEEVQAMVRNAAGSLGPDDWLIGWGWNESAWPEPRMPDSTALDAISESRPILLYHRIGRIAWLNRAALRAAAIDRDTPEPDGGMILRDADERPNGVLLGSAVDSLESALPRAAPEVRRSWILSGLQAAAAVGYTRVMTAPTDAEAVRQYVGLAEDGLLPIRVDLRLRPDATDAAPEGPAGGRLRTLAVGVEIDGPLPPRLAALEQEYADGAGNGLLSVGSEELSAMAETAARAGLGLHVQAHGDRAIESALRLIGSAQGGMLIGWDLPGPGAAEQAALAGVTVAVVPMRFASDVFWLEHRVGPERAVRAHPWSELPAASVTWAVASDAPAYPLAPGRALLALTERSTVDGYPPGGWHPEQSIPRPLALRALARSTAPEGLLSPGSPADLVVWSEDLVSGDNGALIRAQALLTLVAGRVVFSRALVQPTTSDAMAVGLNGTDGKNTLAGRGGLPGVHLPGVGSASSALPARRAYLASGGLSYGLLRFWMRR